jgi:short-subunit dehydrogenase
MRFVDYKDYKELEKELEQLREMKKEIKNLIRNTGKTNYIMVVDLEELIFKHSKPLGKLIH